MSNADAGIGSSAQGVRTVVIERIFPHAPEKLWRALTESTLVAEWLLTNDFAPRVGHRFQFHSQPMLSWDGTIECEVLLIEPFKRLSYTWSALGLDSVVLFTLTPVEGGTQLRMEQSGFRADQEAAYQGATYGWKHFLGNLDRVLGGVA